MSALASPMSEDPLYSFPPITKTCPAFCILVIDRSGSMRIFRDGRTRMQKVKVMLKDLVAFLLLENTNVLFYVMTFSTCTDPIQGPYTLGEITDVVMSLEEPEGETNLFQSICRSVKFALTDPFKSKWSIFVTGDGDDTNSHEFLGEARRLTQDDFLAANNMKIFFMCAAPIPDLRLQIPLYQMYQDEMPVAAPLVDAYPHYVEARASVMFDGPTRSLRLAALDSDDDLEGCACPVSNPDPMRGADSPRDLAIPGTQQLMRGISDFLSH